MRPDRLRSAITAAAARLAAAGIETPRTDSELLAAHALGVPRGRLLLFDDFTEAQRAAFDALVAARERRVPLQHLTGTVAAGAVDVAVGPGVFVPRPETELLVAWGMSRELPGAPLVVDLCSGSGVIALAVAAARPGARVIAVERDDRALGWLRRNTAGTEIEIIAGDVTDPATTAALDGRVDLVLCNPPYVPAGTPVPPEVADHDPPEAVFAGPDGLDVIRPVIARSAALLRTGGWVGIEHDEAHGAAVAGLYAAAGGFTAIEVHPDLAGRPRFSTARRAE